MEEGTLGEVIYGFIGAYAWYLTFAMYILLGIIQAVLGGTGIRRKKVKATAAPSAQ